MTPKTQIQISHALEWDTPWSVQFLVLTFVIFVSWTIWQLIREGRLSKLSWWILFVGTRTTVAAVLLWMILGPTSVLTRTESHPRAVAVYVDNSSSMQIQDQTNAVSDRRWEIAGNYQPHSVTAADRVAFFASALRQQSLLLNDAFDQQQSNEEKREIASKCQLVAAKCSEWLGSDAFVQSLTADQQSLHNELRQILKEELSPLVDDLKSTIGGDASRRELQMQQTIEHAESFAARCMTLAESLSNRLESAEVAARSTSPVESPTRMERALPALRQSLREWSKDAKHRYQIRISQFSESVTPLTLDGWESSLNQTSENASDSGPTRRTNLTDLLKQIRDDAGKEDLAAAVILTDGRHTAESAEDPRDIVGQLRLPIFPVPIGHGEMKRDLILRQVNAPATVIQNDKILINGLVTAHRCPGEACDIRIIEGNQVLDKARVTFKAEQDDQRFHFELPTDKIGRREFKIEVDRLHDEHSNDNNQKIVAVDVTDSTLRVLLADGRSRWEFQYLVNLFNRQDTIELSQLKFAPSPTGTGRLKNRPRFPETVEEWSEYRVVILGDVSPRQLSRKCQDSLYEYVVHRGGSVILIAGQNEMPHAFHDYPLEQLLPVENVSSFAPDKQGYRVELTAEGKTSDVMQFADDLASTEQVWRESSASLPMYSLSSYHKAKPNSQVLLNAVPVKEANSTVESPVFLCWQTVGAGKVAFFSSPSTYQLRNRNGDKYHHRFWGQLIRWVIARSGLAGSKTVKLVADKSNYSKGDTAQLTVELANTDGKPVQKASPVVDVISKGEVVSNVNLTPDAKVPGRYLGTYSSPSEGKFTLRARGPDVNQLLAAEKYADPVQILIEFEPGLDRELSDPRNDRPLLEHLAERTGGVVLEPTVLAELIHAVSLEPRTHESSQKTSLWDRWWCLWVILGCLTLEWIIRKQVGLA